MPANTMFSESFTVVTVEWWDGVTGCWVDLGESATCGDAATRIAGLRASDESGQHYRIVQRIVTSV